MSSDHTALTQRKDINKMNMIKTYLDNMFLNLPQTNEVLHAKNSLGSMMASKYSEFRRKGFSENEAIGHVIAEYGDLAATQGGYNSLSLRPRMKIH